MTGLRIFIPLACAVAFVALALSLQSGLVKFTPTGSQGDREVSGGTWEGLYVPRVRSHAPDELRRRVVFSWEVPKKILRGESTAVAVKVDVDLVRLRPDDALSFILTEGEKMPSIEARIDSAGLEISPKANVTMAAGGRALWTILGTSLGRQTLTLSFQQGDMLLEASSAVPSGARADGSSLQLARVEVLHESGLSHRTFLVCRGAILMLAGLLTYPLWIQWVQRRLGWKEG